MAIHTSDAPLPSPTTKSRQANDNLEAEAIGLEVPVLIHGSQVTAVVMETTEHAEPFEEETSTMIVFPRGAVIKLLAHVRTGHVLVLTNLRSHQDALCKVIQVNSVNNNAVHYVKLEFVQASPGFWGVHFPSDPLPSSRQQETKSPAPFAPPMTQPKPMIARPEHAAPTSTISPSPKQEPAIVAPPALEPQATPQFSASSKSSISPASPGPNPQLAEMTFPASLSASTPTRDAANITSPAPKDTHAASKPASYGLARNWQKEAIEPLASSASASPVEEIGMAKGLDSSPAASSTVSEKIPAPGPRSKIVPSAAAKAEKRIPKPERPVFGALHTFSDAPATAPEIAPMPALPSESVTRPTRSRSKAGFILAAVCVIAVVAAGVTYVRRNPSVLVRFTASAQNPPTQTPDANVPPAMNPLQASNPAPITPPAATASAASSPTDNAARIDANPPVVKSSVLAENTPEEISTPAREKSKRPTTESASSSESAAAKSHPPASNSLADIYAGDLNAKPQITPHKTRRMNAPMPDISSAAPAADAASPNSAALGSLLPGSETGIAPPPAPANPQPAIRQGGVVEPPKLISSTPPVYPGLAKQANVEGDVEIQAEIGISGNVTSMKVISGPSLLRTAAMNALRRWRYLPAKLDGKPIMQQYIVTIRFRLHQ